MQLHLIATLSNPLPEAVTSLYLQDKTISYCDSYQKEIIQFGQFLSHEKLRYHHEIAFILDWIRSKTLTYSHHQ